MKFLCPGCKAKYQIADQKVAGKTLKMNCRQCGEEIVIRGDAPTAPPRGGAGPVPPPPPPAAPPSALGAGFRGQLNSRAPSPPTAAPDEWHVAINDIPVGPMRREEVGRKIAAGAVKPESLAWREGLDDWLPVRSIPELAVLCQQAGVLSVPAAPPPPSHQPEMRAPQVAPVGARMAPMPPPEPPPPAFGGSSPGVYGAPIGTPMGQQPGMSPMDNTGISVVQAMPTDRQQPNMAAMIFMALAAGAFLIMLGGLMFKMMSTPPEAPQAAAPTVAAPPPVAQPEPEEEEPAAHVIDLDLEEIEAEADEEETADARAKSATRGTTTKKPAGGKQLTAEEKARLERMGGGFGTTPSSLGRSAGGGSSAGGGGGGGSGLTASQLSKVVLKQRKDLQRCYETALRKSPSDDPVKLVVEITVSASGNVSKTSVTGNGLMGMDQCIQRTVKAWRFPSAGQSSTVKFPLLFQPGA